MVEPNIHVYRNDLFSSLLLYPTTVLVQMKINQTGDRKLECNVNQDTKNNKKKKQTQKYILKKIPYSFLNFDTTHIKEKQPITFMIKPGWKHQKKLNSDEKN